MYPVLTKHTVSRVNPRCFKLCTVYLVVNNTHLACIQMSLLHYFYIWMQKGGRGGWKARTDILLTTLNVVPSPVLTLNNMNDQPVNPSNYLHHDMVCLVAFLQTKFKCSPEIFVWWWKLYSRPSVQTRKLYKFMAERGWIKTSLTSAFL